MAIFIPRWGRFKDKKPTGPVDVNWNNDLTRGLTFLAGFGPKDLVGNLSETLSEDVTKLGADGSYNFITRTNTANPGVTFGDNHDYPANGMTATVIAKASSWNQTDGTAVTGLFGKGGTTGSGKWGIFSQNTTLNAFVTTSADRIITVSGVLQHGSTHVMTWASLASSGTDYLYLDGKTIGSTSANSGTPSSTAYNLRIGAYGNSSGAYYRFIGEVPLAFLHGRKITTDEAKEIAIYPYQLLKPRSQFFFLGTSAANETADIALTTVNPTIAIGASQLQHTDVAITTTNPTIAAELSQTLHADVAITTVNPTIAATVNETVVLASVALTTQNPIISARITGGEPDFVLGGVPFHSEVKRGKRRWELDEEYEAEYNENVPVDNPLIKLDGSVTKIKESMDHAKKQADKKDEDDVKAIVQFVKQYRSNIISTWLN